MRVTALKLARLFNTTPDLWLNMERARDLWEQRRELAGQLASRAGGGVSQESAASFGRRARATTEMLADAEIEQLRAIRLTVEICMHIAVQWRSGSWHRSHRRDAPGHACE